MHSSILFLLLLCTHTHAYVSFTMISMTGSKFHTQQLLFMWSFTKSLNITLFFYQTPYIACGTRSGEILLWDCRNIDGNSTPIISLQVHGRVGNSVTCLSILRDENYLISTSANGKVSSTLQWHDMYYKHVHTYDLLAEIALVVYYIIFAFTLCIANVCTQESIIHDYIYIMVTLLQLCVIVATYVGIRVGLENEQSGVTIFSRCER